MTYSRYVDSHHKPTNQSQYQGSEPYLSPLILNNDEYQSTYTMQPQSTGGLQSDSSSLIATMVQQGYPVEEYPTDLDGFYEFINSRSNLLRPITNESDSKQNTDQRMGWKEAMYLYPSLCGFVSDEYCSGESNAPLLNMRTSIDAWEEELTLCVSLTICGHKITRRCDSNMINGTKLLNYIGLTRGRRDGILKNEKCRIVIKMGSQERKGVWIPLEQAGEFARESSVLGQLNLLFTPDLTSFLYSDENITLTRQALFIAKKKNFNFSFWEHGIPQHLRVRGFLASFGLEMVNLPLPLGQRSYSQIQYGQQTQPIEHEDRYEEEEPLFEPYPQSYPSRRRESGAVIKKSDSRIKRFRRKH